MVVVEGVRIAYQSGWVWLWLKVLERMGVVVVEGVHIAYQSGLLWLWLRVFTR